MYTLASGCTKCADKMRSWVVKTYTSGEAAEPTIGSVSSGLVEGGKEQGGSRRELVLLVSRWGWGLEDREECETSHSVTYIVICSSSNRGGAGRSAYELQHCRVQSWKEAPAEGFIRGSSSKDRLKGEDPGKPPLVAGALAWEVWKEHRGGRFRVMYGCFGVP